MLCASQDEVSLPRPAVATCLREETEEKRLSSAKELRLMALQQLTCNKCTKHLGREKRREKGREERREKGREKRREKRREKGSKSTAVCKPALLLGNVNFQLSNACSVVKLTDCH